MKKILSSILICCAVSVSCSKEFVRSITITHPDIYDGALQMKIGDLLQLEATLTPASSEADIEWKSSDQMVATVFDGYLEAVGAGVATISAIAPNGKTASIDVYVGRIKVDSWSVPSTVEAAPGYKASFDVTISSPSGALANNLIWSYSDNGNPSDSKLNNGFTYSINKNTVSVIIPSGSEFEGKHGYLKCENTEGASKIVEISFVTRRPTSLSLSAGSSTLAIGAKTNLYLSITPANATVRDIEWTVSDPGVVAFDQASMTANALHSGTCTITAKAAGTSVTASKTLTVKGLSISAPVAMFSDETRTVTLKDASAAVKWSVDNPAIATIDENSGELTGKSEGFVTVSANHNGDVSTAMVMVVRKGFVMNFYRYYDIEPATGYAKSTASEKSSSIYVPLDYSRALYVGFSNGYIIDGSVYASLYANAQSTPMTVTYTGSMQAAMEFSALCFYPKSGKWGETTVATVKDCYGASGTFSATYGFQTLTLEMRPYGGQRTYSTIKVGETVRVKRPSTNWTDIYVYGNTNATYDDSNSDSYSYGIWYQEDHPFVNDEGTFPIVKKSGHSEILCVDAKTTQLGTYHFHASDIPDLKFTLVVE